MASLFYHIVMSLTSVVNRHLIQEELQGDLLSIDDRTTWSFEWKVEVCGPGAPCP